ncbi:MAG: EAL domain-containing protein [Gammaproteobacteria bacterium]|nr:EAL domain-containing protein [Gammaproteobacteria bacterium]
MEQTIQEETRFHVAPPRRRGLQVRRIYLATVFLMTGAFLLFAISSWIETRRTASNELEHASRMLHDATTVVLAHQESMLRVLGRRLEDRLRQEIARVGRSGRSLAVMYVDLDQFKRVNDSFGHTVGDGLLLAAAHRLNACLREGDTVGRLGGDEFLLLFPDLHSAADAQPLADRVLEAFDGRFLVEGRELFSTASIGVALCPDDGTDSGTLLQNADTALYRAKDAGRHGVCFFRQEYSRAATRRVVVENALHLALERDELRVVYQPKCDARSRRWMGAEALLRWHSATLGEVSPGEFIPVAEDTGLIAALGQFVLVRAVEDLVRIQAVAPDFTMAVNVSVRQFDSPNLVTGVVDLLEQFGIAPAMLELEVTESIMAATIPQLDLLREAGLRLAIDDFGTGFSSLSYLKRLPVTTLKLDREFVRDLETDPADKALLKAMIKLAQELDLETVAEGVETEGQAAFLQQQRVSQLQGYLLARPMPVDELLVRLQEPGRRSSR